MLHMTHGSCVVKSVSDAWQGEVGDARDRASRAEERNQELEQTVRKFERRQARLSELARSIRDLEASDELGNNKSADDLNVSG